MLVDESVCMILEWLEDLDGPLMLTFWENNFSLDFSVQESDDPWMLVGVYVCMISEW